MSEDSRPFYDSQSTFYELTRRLFLVGRSRMIDELALQPGERAIEVGCGTGWNLKRLAKAVGPQGRVVGLEISPMMLAKARSKRPPPQVELHGGDIGNGFPSREPFDAALFSYSLSAIQGPEKALRNLLAILRPQGRIASVDFCINPFAPKWLQRRFAEHGKRHTCDFKLNPETLFQHIGFKTEYTSQTFGFSYRLLARRG